MKDKNTKIDNINSYINSFDSSIQFVLNKIRKLIQGNSPDAEECIRYGIPTFQLNGKNLVHFAAYKNHIGFYPTPSGIDAFKNQLSSYEYSKGTVKFPLERDIPYRLIEEMVKYRTNEILNNI